MANTKKRWTVSEDTILREAVKSGLGLEDVAQALGRTRESVAGRKWFLKLDGRFKGTGKVVHNKQPRTQAAKPAQQASENDGLWQIEDNVPLPTRGNASKAETEIMIGKVRNLLNQIKVNQSFVIPRNVVRHVLNLAKTEFEAYRLKTSATSKEKKFYRIYRIA